MSDSRTPEYRSWKSMLERCLQAHHHAFRHYGGRGITVCERWRDFANFLADMGARPNGCSLDRIDNSKGYDPGNCRWATWTEQGRNRRANRVVTVDGVRMPAVVAAERFNFPYQTLMNRLRLGWSAERALREPIANGGPPGIRQHLAKLDDVSAECLRVVYALRIFDQRTLARWWGVTQATVKQVVTGKTWKHVGGPRTFGRIYS